jgi:hypothetical protein
MSPMDADYMLASPEELVNTVDKEKNENET